MTEKVQTVVENTTTKPEYYLKKVLKSYQMNASKNLHGPSSMLSTERENIMVKKEPGCCNGNSLCESSPELPLGATPTPPPPTPHKPIPQVPVLSTADQSGELTTTRIEGQDISCFLIGGERRLCFVQLLSTVLRNVQPYSINRVVTELFINFSTCNSQQLLMLKAEGLLPAETATCGLVTKPDAERLCSVLLHEGVLLPDGVVESVEPKFVVYHECFSGARGFLYYEYFSEKNWFVQCEVCRRLFTPQMFVCHSCYRDKRNTIHTYIETGICHWGFQSEKWQRYLYVLEDQDNYDKYCKIFETFKSLYKTSELTHFKRKQEPNDIDGIKVAAEELVPSASTIAAKRASAAIITSPSTATLKVERFDDEEEERWYLKKRTKTHDSLKVEDMHFQPIACPTIAPFYNELTTFYANLCDSWPWARNPAYSHHAAPWTNYPPPPVPFSKDAAKTFCFTESVPFLAQDPPVLLHPERVVPLSQSEQFERSYQPNVALAPPTKTSDGVTYSKMKSSVIRVKSDCGSTRSTVEDAESSSTSPCAGKEEKCEKVEVKIQPISPSDSQPSTSGSPRTSPASASAEPIQDNGVNSVVEQVAAVLDALSDAEDAVRQRVISLVERLTLKIDRCDEERQKDRDEIAQLRMRVSQLEDYSLQLYTENTHLRRQLVKEEEKDITQRPPSPSITNNNVSYPSSSSSSSTSSSSNRNSNTPGISPKQPVCSPVSVITSPPPSLSVIRSESAA